MVCHIYTPNEIGMQLQSQPPSAAIPLLQSATPAAPVVCTEQPWAPNVNVSTALYCVLRSAAGGAFVCFCLGAGLSKRHTNRTWGDIALLAVGFVRPNSAFFGRIVGASGGNGVFSRTNPAASSRAGFRRSHVAICFRLYFPQPDSQEQG